MSEQTLSSAADAADPSPEAVDPSPPTPRRPSRRPSREGRAWVRYPVNAEVSFQPLEARKEGSWRPATVRDISTKGLGLILEAPVEGGAILAVKLAAASRRLAQPLLVRVVRPGVQSGGGWYVGCTFAIPLSEHELQTLVPENDPSQAATEDELAPRPLDIGNRPAHAHGPFFQGSAEERRTYPRRRIAVPVILSYVPAAGGPSAEKEALAIDASGGGMKLLAQDCLGRGTSLRLRSAKAPQSASVEVRVKSCSPQQSKWLIGVQFLQTPPSEFMLFFR